MRVLSGHGDASAEPLERALMLAEGLQLPEVFVEALTSKGLVVLLQGRLAEARILLEAAAARAHTEQLYASALRAENNLGVVLEASDRHAEALETMDRALALARRRGDRRWESNLRTGGLIQLFLLGRWDEAIAIATEEEPLVAGEAARASMLCIALIRCEQADLGAARDFLTTLDSNSENAQTRAGYAGVEARLLRAEGLPAEALEAAERALATRGELPMNDTSVKAGLVEAIEAALALPNLDKAEELLAIADSLDPGDRTPFLQANAARLHARLDAARGEHEHVEERFRSAAGLFREFGLVFHLAVTQLEHGEWLVAQGRADEAHPLLAEAHETFERLQATPWLERSADFVLQQH
jgi:tetratricopeptide (TPR) repeat protein